MTAPFDRTKAIARVGFLMPGTTDDGLMMLVEAAEEFARVFPRDLTPATLAAEQRAREAEAGHTHGAGEECAACEWCTGFGLSG